MGLAMSAGVEEAGTEEAERHKARERERSVELFAPRSKRATQGRIGTTHPLLSLICSPWC